MTTFALELLGTVLTVVLIVYTAVAITHYALQLYFAHRTYRVQRSASFEAAFPGVPLSVDVVVPVYNEEPGLLEACVRSALAQDHAGPIRVFVVDDGSPNRASLDPVYDRLEEAGATVIRSPRNVGKRHAQALALPLARGEILVTLDSDSVLEPSAVRLLTRQFADDKVGAATGFVDVMNRHHSLLTRIQRIRYWMAFNQERAAQTWFRTVMCCSGPLAAYRRELVERVRDAYLSQRYGGVACTYGDDRHLTNLILGLGYDTVFESGARAYTHVPERWRMFLRQQLRWTKSFYRELVWTRPYIGRRPWFSRFDVASQVAMPVLLTLTAGTSLVIGIFGDPGHLLRYLGLIAIAATIRATYAAVRERSLSAYVFIVYGYVSAFLLMSVRLVALGTLADARWGTRGGPRLSPEQAIDPVPTWLVPQAAGAGGGSAPPRFDGAWRAGLSLGSMARTEAAPTALAAGTPLGPDPGSSSSPDRATPAGCGHRIPPGARFCRACGAPLVSGSEAD